MEPFRRLTAIAAALPQANVDTDQIMPKQFLRGVDRQGLDRGFLYDLRFCAPDTPRREFVLNRAPWDRAEILVAGPNFGCGSSREHAVWGMRQLGLRCVIASSFGGIFSDNCTRNGVPAIIVPPEEAARLLDLVADPTRCEITVDLEARTITSHGDGRMLSFAIDPLRRQMLLDGTDAVGVTLQYAEDIRRFENQHLRSQPWLA